MTEGKKTGDYYLRPYKRLLVDIVVSLKSLDTGLDVANQLFLEFEKHGYRITLAPTHSGFQRHGFDLREGDRGHDDYQTYWAPARPTVVHIGDMLIGLTFFETSELVEIPGRWGVSSRERPSGRYILQSYSPYRGTSWVKQWNIHLNKSLSRQGSRIADELFESTTLIAEEIEAARLESERRAREWEEQQERWRREEEQKNREKSFDRSNEQLLEVIRSWAQAKSIESFFREIELAIPEQDPSKQPGLWDRLAEARKVIGTVDALQDFTKWKSPEEIYKTLRKVWF
jgi:hypothetical protein